MPRKGKPSSGKTDKPGGVADMSLPPEQRGRKRRRSRAGKGAVAQMDHATSPRARKKARQGEKALRRGRKSR